MKNLTKIILALTLFSLGLFAFSPWSAAQSLAITQIQTTDFKNNTAKVTWDSNYPSKGTVFYSDNSQNLDRSIDYPVYDYSHVSLLSGLKENTRYYYKIVAYDRAGQRVETFIQTFETKNMIDTEPPTLLSFDLLQVTANAVAVNYKSDEPVRATLYWGPPDNLNQKKVISGYKDSGPIFIYNLKADERYRIRLEITDKAGNKAQKDGVFNFNTNSPIRDGNDFRIYDVQPTNINTDYVSDTTATISWKTNLAAQSYIQYSERSNRYGQRIYAQNSEWSTIHQIKLTGLKPNTTYYFKITAEKSLYNKRTASQEMSFTTLPSQTQGQVLGERISSNGQPNKPVFVYGQPRASLGLEQAKAIELKNALDKRLGKFSVSRNDWFKLVNAYVYGGYPIESLAQCVKWGGKTVHPSIPWQAWQNSSDYKNYINR
ncbi:MAG: fibronectin type III domain-containing protein [Patescibacteria group bacterium]|nr:fibronectin type III domain-containing protein [Patescibacteria group bacterium]